MRWIDGPEFRAVLEIACIVFALALLTLMGVFILVTHPGTLPPTILPAYGNWDPGIIPRH